MNPTRIVFGAATAAALLLAGVAVAAMAAPADPGAGAQSAAAQTANGYAGDDTCLICHSDKDYKGTLHGQTLNPRSPASAKGCETCHGPGKAHSEANGDVTKIRNPKKLKPGEVSAICTTCHNRGEHAFWEGSQHDRRGLTCTTCHSNHTPESTSGRLVAKTQQEVCGRCHRDKVAKLDRSGHMPVREGKLQCSSCHNMHGSQNVRLLRVGYSVNEACTSCHPEKRGPFLWEHPPVRENCATCHDPHGSSNERMLVAKLPFLCQRCHVHSRHPATVYDSNVFKSSNRVYGRGCVNCHSAIHGSVHPAGMAFQR